MTKLPMLGAPLIGEPPAHVMRMLDEANELGQRLAALEDFSDTPIFKALVLQDQHLMQAQSATMQAYLRILLMRIDRTKKKEH